MPSINEKRWRVHEGFRHLSDVRQVAVDSRWCSAIGLSDRERLVWGRFDPPPDVASRSEPNHDCDVQVCVVGSVTHSKLLAASWSGTAWSTSGWSGTGWSTAGATSWLAAATNLAALDLGQAELGQLEAV